MINPNILSRLTYICDAPVPIDAGKSLASHKFGKYKCLCGKEVVVAKFRVKLGTTKWCGCLASEHLKKIQIKNRLPKGEAARNRLYCGYKLRAKDKHNNFDLTLSQFTNITQSNCEYCGISPSSIRRSNSTLSKPDGGGSYTYNGIDRVDNTIGYILGNVVSCCKICNYMKNTLSKEEFLSHIKRIHDKNYRNIDS